MRKLSWFAALAALMLCGVAPVVGGCGDDDDSSGDGDADVDADTDADTDADGDADCQSGDPLANDGCDWTCNDPAAPDFRLTFVDLTAPGALTNPLIAGVISGAVDDGTFVWLVDNQGGGNFATGAGLCTDEALSMCDFEGGDFPPATGTMDMNATTGEFRLPGGTDTMDVDVVVHSDSVGDVVLKVKDAFISGTVSHGGNCIGSRLNDFLPADWDTAGHLTGKMTVADAMSVEIGDPLNMTLCEFLSGGQPAAGYCDDNPDPTTWPNAPDTTVGGQPAWQMEGDLAAIGVMIP